MIPDYHEVCLTFTDHKSWFYYHNVHICHMQLQPPRAKEQSLLLLYTPHSISPHGQYGPYAAISIQKSLNAWWVNKEKCYLQPGSMCVIVTQDSNYFPRLILLTHLHTKPMTAGVVIDSKIWVIYQGKSHTDKIPDSNQPRDPAVNTVDLDEVHYPATGPYYHMSLSDS